VEYGQLALQLFEVFLTINLNQWDPSASGPH